MNKAPFIVFDLLQQQGYLPMRGKRFDLMDAFTHSIASAQRYLFINSLKFYYYDKFSKQASEC